MAQNSEVEMPSYIVYRDVALGQPFDPTTPLAFFPPKGSDELFDALRAKYPHLKSHSERVREAVIEFLVEESQLDHPQDHQMAVPQPAQLTTTSPSQYPAMLPSAGSDTSTWSSPDSLSLATSSFEGSPRTWPRSREFSIATSGTEPSETSPPALEQMTGVFSLSDSSQPKQRIRRKMTEREKVEYRKRRIVKACETCSKRKRKCNHNQQEMESVASKSQKIPRSSAASTSKKKPPDQNLEKTQVPEESLTAIPMDFDDPFRCELMQPFDDFSDLLDVPLPDLNLDDLLAPSQVQWPWAHTADFTLMDSSGDSFVTRPQGEFSAEHDLSPQDLALFSESEAVYDYNRSQSTSGDQNHSSMLWEHLRTGQQSDELPTHTAHVHDTDCVAQDGTLMRSNARGFGDGRRSTHSSPVQGREDTASQIIHEEETSVSLNANTAGAADHLHMERDDSNLNIIPERSHNIHSRVGRAKRRIKGIDAGSMIAASPSEPHLQNQQHPSTPRSPQPLSLGELGHDILGNMSPRTELFRLRLRIPKALHSIVDRNNASSTSDAVFSQQTVSPTRTQARRHEEPGAVVAYNVEHAGVNSYQITEGALQQLSSASHGDAGVAMLPGDPTSTQLLRSGAQLSTVLSHLDQTDGYQERLSDHVRHRDHFGRHINTDLQVLGTVASLGCLLMLLSLLPTHTSNLALLVLALVSPVRGATGTHVPRRSCVSEAWGTFLQSTIKNSAWGARINTRMSSLLQEWKNISRSTWSKETGQTSYGGLWCMWNQKQEGGHVGVRVC